MPRTLQEVKTYQIDYICDVCKKGKMRIDSVTYIAPIYPHVCNNRDCGHKKNFDVKYPAIGHAVVGNEEPYVGEVQVNG